MAAVCDERTVLAIDPGRAKCGLAIVTSQGSVLHRTVIARPDLSAVVRDLLNCFRPEMLLLGNGTHADAIREELEDFEVALELVDERHTSELARARYLKENTPTGIGRLVPRPLRTPDIPYDDYVAVILAERWWNCQKSAD